MLDDEDTFWVEELLDELDDDELDELDDTDFDDDELDEREASAVLLDEEVDDDCELILWLLALDSDLLDDVDHEGLAVELLDELTLMELDELLLLAVVELLDILE